MNSTGQRIAAVEGGVDIFNGNYPALAPPSPGITNQNINVATNGSVTINVLNGVSGNPDPTTLSIVSDPSHGQAVDPTGTITYTPDLGYIGSDSLVYQVCSSLDNTVCSQATLSFSVGVAVTAPNTGFGTQQSKSSWESVGIYSIAAFSLLITSIGLRTYYTYKSK